MVAQLELTMNDVEKYTGVTGIPTAKLSSAVLSVVGTLRSAVAMSGVVTAVGTGGSQAIVGVTMLPMTVGVTGGVALSALFAVSVVAPFLAVAGNFLRMGMSVAEAKQIVGERSIKQGFATGCVIGLLGHGKGTVSDFADRTVGAGIAPGYMSGVSQRAFNTGLVLGYSASIKLSRGDKERYRGELTQHLIAMAKSRGGKLYMKTWSDRTWIYEYTGAFMSTLMK